MSLRAVCDLRIRWAVAEGQEPLMPSLITTTTGDKIMVDEYPAQVAEKCQVQRMVLLTLYGTTPRREVRIHKDHIESIREEKR